MERLRRCCAWRCSHIALSAHGASLASLLADRPLRLPTYLSSDDAGCAIAEGLRRNSSITFVDLSNSGLGTTAARALAYAMELNTTVRILNVLGNPGIDDDIRASLRGEQTSTSRSPVKEWKSPGGPGSPFLLHSSSSFDASASFDSRSSPHEKRRRSEVFGGTGDKFVRGGK